MHDRLLATNSEFAKGILLMNVFITGDSNVESGVVRVVVDLSGPTADYFAPRNYGASVAGIAIVLMCRDPELKFKQRRRFSKKDKTLYLDIMLDIVEMESLEHSERVDVASRAIITEVPAALERYRFEDFETDRFVSELTEWLVSRSRPER